jgi:shikimate 5-dehydrogenase
MTQSIQGAAGTDYPPATKPTLYFIGMTTAKSAIMNIFPRWAEYLELGDVALQGLDFKWHDQPAAYRRAVEFIKRDPLSRGALVTTHKMDLFSACQDLFDEVDSYAALMKQVCSLSKRTGQLRARAIDQITSSSALQAFLPKKHWEQTDGEVLCLGAGGSSVAITSYLLDAEHGPDRPKRIVVSNRSPGRLSEIKQVHDQILPPRNRGPIALEYHATPRPEDNDALLATLPPHSLVINATGLGKDAPGSPLTGSAAFPEKGFAWDFNYRGALVFLDQARAQARQRQLTLQDGWIYFIHGWTTVISQVFDVEIPGHGPGFEQLSKIAAAARGPAGPP